MKQQNNNQIEKLVLGTVQFGLPYGVANSQGQISEEEGRAIIDTAWSAGLSMLDTAIAYGDSEACLGRMGISQWEVVSKLPAVPDSCSDVQDWILKSVESSLERLRISQLYGFLLHRPDQLQSDGGGAIYQALVRLKEERVVKKIGISIYDPAELDLLQDRFKFDIVQAPFNPLDHRLIESGWMERLSQQRIEIHVRSVFLQGLLLMSLGHRPKKFDRWQSTWLRWKDWLAESNCTPLQACLRHALAQPQIDRVIVGVDCLNHLNEILLAADGIMPDLPSDLHCHDLDLINPKRWGQFS